MHRAQRFAWARLNAYGLLIVGLLLLSATDLLNPETSTVAKITGRVPELQPAWAIGFVLAALCLLVGFLRGRTMPEVAGLGLISAGLTVQSAVLVSEAGLESQPGVRAVAIWIIVVGCSALRASVLLSKQGLTVTIPGRARPGAE